MKEKWCTAGQGLVLILSVLGLVGVQGPVNVIGDNCGTQGEFQCLSDGYCGLIKKS